LLEVLFKDVKIDWLFHVGGHENSMQKAMEDVLLPDRN